MTVQRVRDSLLPRVLAPWIPGSIHRGPARDSDGHPLFYLTVDDGPSASGTPLWLDVLGRHDARAVFFLSAPLALKHADLTRQLARSHRIGNHGWEHASGWRVRPGRVRRSMQDAEKALEDLVGAPVRDVRPPYGRVTPALVRWSARGRRIVLWDTMPGDFVASRPPADLASELVALVRPGSIAVFHDGAPASRAVAALDLALPTLAAAGWRFPLLPAP